MRKTILQFLLLLIFASLCIGGYLLVHHVLSLPFRSTNDALHKSDSAINLDFLIPAGTYIDEKMTIKQIIHMRFEKHDAFYEKALEGFLKNIPVTYRYLTSLVTFLFFAFSFMAFFRVFTFMGYGRAIRTSLLFAGIIYYFLPDIIHGITDDLFFFCFPVLIIVLRMVVLRKKRKKRTLAV